MKSYNELKNFIKSLTERVPSAVFERLTAISIIKEKFSDVRLVPRFNKREDLWKDVFDRFNDDAVTVLEFGVYQGYSIKKFTEFNANANSKFYGFDSFLGLPEDWTGTRPKGTFNVDGNEPKVTENRIKFVKGWFQNTLPNFLQENEISGNLFVHYDADIFSATLYAMLEVDKLKIPYFAVFDEFTGHETRALHHYMQISGAEIEFIASTVNKQYPAQVSCVVKPVKEFNI
jgi:O-methyltransferase